MLNNAIWKTAVRLPAVLLGAGLMFAGAGSAVAPAQAQDTIRIGLPTKTYYPTIIAETALRQGLFAKEGIKAELTIYRSGSETFEARVRRAAELGFTDVIAHWPRPDSPYEGSESTLETVATQVIPGLRG